MPTDLDRLFGEDTTNGTPDPLDSLDPGPAAAERERHAPDADDDRERAAILRERADWLDRRAARRAAERAAAARPVGEAAPEGPPAGADADPDRACSN